MVWWGISDLHHNHKGRCREIPDVWSDADAIVFRAPVVSRWELLSSAPLQWEVRHFREWRFCSYSPSIGIHLINRKRQRKLLLFYCPLTTREIDLGFHAELNSNVNWNVLWHHGSQVMRRQGFLPEVRDIYRALGTQNLTKKGQKLFMLRNLLFVANT